MFKVINNSKEKHLNVVKGFSPHFIDFKKIFLFQWMLKKFSHGTGTVKKIVTKSKRKLLAPKSQNLPSPIVMPIITTQIKIPPGGFVSSLSS